jgi:hypothetical protein
MIREDDETGELGRRVGYLTLGMMEDLKSSACS